MERVDCYALIKTTRTGTRSLRMLRTSKQHIRNCLNSGLSWSGSTSIFTHARNLSMLHTSSYEVLDCLDSAWLWIRPTRIFTSASSLSMFHSGLRELSACMYFPMVTIGIVYHMNICLSSEISPACEPQLEKPRLLII